MNQNSNVKPEKSVRAYSSASRNFWPGQNFWPQAKISAWNSGLEKTSRKFRPEIPGQNFKPKFQAKILGQNSRPRFQAKKSLINYWMGS